MYKIIPIILILAIGFLSIRLFVVLLPKKGERVSTKEGVSYLASLESADVKKTEEAVRKAQEKYSGAEERKKIEKEIKSGNYQYAFKDILICGDSIVKAISAYGYLDESHVYAKVGAGTPWLEDMTETIVSTNPKYLILHFGENQLGPKESVDYFIDSYSECIKTLQKKLPNTEIYVDSIFPCQEFAYGSNSYLRNIAFYNQHMEKMAKALKVHYIDFTPSWNAFEKDYYDADGVHPIGPYYTEQYLPQILMEVGYRF